MLEQRGRTRSIRRAGCRAESLRRLRVDSRGRTRHHPGMTTASSRRRAAELGPALEFLRHLWQLNQALERVSARMQKRLGITAQQRLIVRCVGKQPGMAAGELARTLHLDPGTISAALKRLEGRRVLSRHRDPGDLRRATLELTEQGRKLARPARGTVEHAVERLLAETSQAEIDHVRKTLTRLSGLLSNEARSSSKAQKRRAARRRRH